MSIGAYSQDVLTRIYNVKWAGGGVFIAINNDGNICYLKLDGSKDNAWENLGTLDFVGPDPDNFIPYPEGCAYAMLGDKNDAKPVFVIVGGSGNKTSPGIIMASKNGKDWSRAHTFSNTADTSGGASVWAVVWNEDAQMFYAGAHTSDFFSDPETVSWQSETDVLFSSPDGFVWTEAGRHVTRIDSGEGGAFPEWPEYPTGLLDAYCSKRWMDSHGNGISDGYYGYDKTKGVLITPNDITEMDYFLGQIGNSFGSRVTVTITGGGDPSSYPPDPGLTYVTCVATAGDKWVVAGGAPDGQSQAAFLAADKDGNPIWKRLDPPGTNGIIAMCAGRLSDVEPNARL